MTIEELNEQCKKCRECRLWEEATQAVPGEGNPKADIMFIGEGPGATEDKTGRPFVGRAGKFLDEMLQSIDLKREDVFIANMVKHRPPGNRDPQEDEMDACRHWLDEQIKIINPKVFVPLGRYAMSKFIPGRIISQEHGNLYSRGGKVYFIMYHPAVALYKGSMRPVLLEDFQNLRKFLNGEIEPESLDDVVNDIIKEKKVTKVKEKVEDKTQQKLF